MKKHIYLFSLLTVCALFTASCEQKQEAKEEPENLEAPASEEIVEQEGPFFGTEFEVKGGEDSESIPALMKEKGGYEGQITGVVDANCKKAGCWMKMKTGDEEMRVTFKDYGFFVPLDSEGKEVVVNGKIYYDTTSVEQLKHFAEDGGAKEEEIAAIVEPKLELRMEATGVYFK